ncbi:MAG: slipin family protein [Candidatus Omnitrophica bacterium]|nr:slipin family protein [Candidatus Omnitrophota bacterium]
MEFMKSLNFLGFGILIFIVFIIAAAIRIVKQYERAIVFRLGKFICTKGPGLIFIIPIIDRALKVDIRVNSIDVPRQETITKDNVSVIVDAVVYYKVENPEKAIIEVKNSIEATFLIAQTTLRSVIGQTELDGLLSQRDEINKNLREIIDKHTTPWGIKVITVEIKELALPEEMKRAMARQAESERERRAKIINAEGEYQAAEKLRQAAEIMSKEPITVQLRYLQTLSEISVDKSSTIIFPVPIDLISNILKKADEKK